MIEWEDVRIFLAVARAGSFSAAARSLKVDHSTVSRRVNAFEKRLGVRLFERLAAGYILTPAGEEMLNSAERMEDEFTSLTRRVSGRDARLSGTIRVTASDAILEKLLIPHLAIFTEQYPDIVLEIVASTDIMNLNKREADVALRVTDHPPEYLIGRRFCQFGLAVYASRDYLATHPDITAPNLKVVTRLEQETTSKPLWLTTNFTHAKISARINSPLLLLNAVKMGLGMSQLACFIGDTEPSLRRVPHAVAETGMDLWLLTHRDIRTTSRIRAFNDFVADVISRQRDLIEGRLPLRD